MTNPESRGIGPDARTTELIPSVSIENMLRMRAGVIERIEEGIRLIREANDLARTGNLGQLDARVYLSYGHLCPFGANDAMQHAARQIDAVAWQHLMNESGLRTVLDATARGEWDRQIERGEIPAFTFDNIAATFERLHDARKEMLERGVIECFRRLSWDYKTNQPFKFGKGIVIERLFKTYGTGRSRWLSLHHPTTDQLDDLVRVFSVLSGRVEPDHRQGIYGFLHQAQHDGRTEWEGDYFAIRWFLKGTGHLTFKRMDVVERMNGILAKHLPRALPAPRR